MISVRNSTAILVLAFLVYGTVSLAQSDTQATFVSKCQPCHGPMGDGNTPMGRKLGVVKFNSEDVIKSSDASLLTAVKNGKGQMPPFANKLSEAQRKDLIVYIRSLSAK
jgi:mono/diheme cytochrome c family protein